MLFIQAEKKARIRNNKLEQGAAKVAEELQKCKSILKAWCHSNSFKMMDAVTSLFWFFFYADDPQSDPNATGDPYKTLFVARLVSNFALDHLHIP